MRVLVIGTEDLTGHHVIKQLSEKNYEPIALVGSPAKVEEMEKLGAAAVYVIEGKDFSKAFSNCQAVIYIAEASPKTGGSMPILIDHRAVIDSIRLAKQSGIKRFILLSAMRANESEGSQEWTTGAKNQPDELLRQEKFTYTVIEPSMAVEKPGVGKIEAGSSLKKANPEIAKEDIASVLVEALENENTFNKTFEISSGDTAIKEAIEKM